MDEKIGYGIYLLILREIDGCLNVYYYKKIREGLYYKLLYDKWDFEILKILEKIVKKNGFIKNYK